MNEEENINEFLNKSDPKYLQDSKERINKLQSKIQFFEEQALSQSNLVLNSRAKRLQKLNRSSVTFNSSPQLNRTPNFEKTSLLKTNNISEKISMNENQESSIKTSSFESIEETKNEESEILKNFLNEKNITPPEIEEFREDPPKTEEVQGIDATNEIKKIGSEDINNANFHEEERKKASLSKTKKNESTYKKKKKEKSEKRKSSKSLRSFDIENERKKEKKKNKLSSKFDFTIEEHSEYSIGENDPVEWLYKISSENGKVQVFPIEEFQLNWF